MTLALAVVAGALIGLSLGALGGGGSILAVPVLVYALGQSPTQATTGSLVVVGTTSLMGALTAYRAGRVLLARGTAFGAVALVGAVAGARSSAHVPESVLLASFAALMLVVAGVMVVRLLRRGYNHPPGSPSLDDPIITLSPTFACECPRALKVLVTATVVGLLTGFLGVGGGFLVVPALLVALALPMEYATGTSLVVITMTSATALAARTGVGVSPDWWAVLVLTAASAGGAVAGARLARRTDTHRLQVAFTVLVLAVAVYTAAGALPALASPTAEPLTTRLTTERRSTHVPSSPMQDVRKDHLVGLRPTHLDRQGGCPRRPVVPRRAHQGREGCQRIEQRRGFPQQARRPVPAGIWCLTPTTSS